MYGPTEYSELMDFLKLITADLRSQWSFGINKEVLQGRYSFETIIEFVGDYFQGIIKLIIIDIDLNNVGLKFLG